MKQSTAIWFAFLLASSAVYAMAQESRIGTFDRRAIVVAYYSSPLWEEKLKQKSAELEQAKRANDTGRIQELNAWGSEAQDLAHRQLTGEAPITNILEALKPAFTAIEKADHLATITAVPPHDSKTQAIDVTDRVLDWLKADEKTRRIISSLPKE